MMPKVRRQLDITTDVWQRMVPGMVGAVNYGSGRKAYDPTQTVAGKTGTCIGDGGWVGLFTSYAPLANPRLAVVVITQGTDARRHFPAAVAGEIYRGLNHRFGTAINLQVASTLDDEEKEVADAEEAAEQTADSMAAETPETSAVPPPVIPAPKTAPATKQEVKPGTPEQRSPVKRVLMPLEKKPEAQKSTQTVTPRTTVPSEQQRPRRIQP
jgi:membrane peptidoglycan carboxypeptidase